MTNINAIHQHLQNTFPKKMTMPEFWCEEHGRDGSLRLYYFSHRGAFLAPVAVGLVTQIAKYRFDLDITMTLLTTQGVDGSRFTSWVVATEDPRDMHKLTSKVVGPERAVTDSAHSRRLQCPMTGVEIDVGDVPGYVVMAPTPSSVAAPPFVASAIDEDLDYFGEETLVQAPLNDTRGGGGGTCPYHRQAMMQQQLDRMSCASSATSWNEDNPSRCPATTATASTSERGGLSAAATRTIFPYHVLIDADFCIRQVGKDLPNVLGTTEGILCGYEIDDVFEFVKPRPAKWTRSWLRKLRDQEFVLECTLSSVPRNVVFKGTWLPSHGNDSMLILCPDAKNLEELREMGLTLSDLPGHGAYRDAVFLREHLSRQMNNALAMEKLSEKLQTEKNLLESLLPSHAAEGLRNGQAVQPMMHHDVTMFFSDIVGFTNICKHISPCEVIDMLNALYSIMDFLAAKFNLFKVETIGDAYVCCSGLPDKDDNHAQNVANFAVAVQHCCRRVLSPLDQQPIQLRVGIHSGECASGIVGVTNPRYCVFGDTVNTTARHESTGLPGKVHCSHTTMIELRTKARKDFIITSRGVVEMKGKGETPTYWIESTEQNELTGPTALHKLDMVVTKRYSIDHVTLHNKETKHKEEAPLSLPCMSLSRTMTSSTSGDTSSTVCPSTDCSVASSCNQETKPSIDANLSTSTALVPTIYNPKDKSDLTVSKSTKNEGLCKKLLPRNYVKAPSTTLSSGIIQPQSRQDIVETMHKLRRERIAKALEATSKILRH
jgi:class 3 adenylate cyclase